MPNWTVKIRVLAGITGILLVLGVFVLLTSHDGGGGAPAVKHVSYGPTPFADYTERTPHVLSVLAITGVQGEVSGASQTPPSELSPLPASAFTRPIAEYHAYAAEQLDQMESQISRLEGALAANDRPAAREAWSAAYSSYLHLGAVYLGGGLATLNQLIDGVPGGLAGGATSPKFTGLHRIEYGLWTGAPLHPLLGLVRELGVDVQKLRGVLPHVSITPLEYATRAHEILEDAARDLLSGTDVPWSGEGVLGTEAGLDATEEVIATLRPLLKGRENVTSIVAAELVSLRSTMASLAAAHSGRLPSNNELTQHQAEQLDSSLGGALEALAQVPGALETEQPPRTPSIPARDERIDP
jgi:iron uptake system EfeUOB component EfeO/EfeM